MYNQKRNPVIDYANTFCIRSNDNKTINTCTNIKQGFKQTFFLQTDDEIFLLEKKL